MTSLERTQIERRHQQAMSFCDRAVSARAEGNHEQSLVEFERAFELERDAARSVADDVDFEPSRSILLRSAASLALECGRHREAEELIARALAGSPPAEIAEELRDLLEQVTLGTGRE